MFVDLSHTVEDGMITYRGLPAPVIRDYWSREYSRRFYAEGTEFHVGQVEMVANTGTYLDSPFHRYVGGKDLSELPLSSLAGLDGLVVRATRRGDRAIDRSFFPRRDIRGRAVLVHTGWDTHWGTDRYFAGHPFLTKDAAQDLAGSGPRLGGSIHSTSTIRRMDVDPFTRSCWPRRFRSSSTSAISSACRIAGLHSSRCP